MIYRIDYSKKAKEDIMRHRKSGDKQILKKIYVLLDELKIHPITGTGKPERLKHRRGDVWSRRITDRHRLVYEIFEEVVLVEVIGAYGHYDNK